MTEKTEQNEKSRRPLALGRGLSSLLGDSVAGAAGERGGVQTVAIAAIIANPRQPRRQFDGEALAELTESIRARGVLQPILIRPVGAGRYEIVAGERRWRASQAAGRHDIPALVRELDDAQAFEIALVENIQRADLDAIEEADGYRRLIDEFGHSQEALARLVGKSRSHVANLLRLLDLPQSVRDHVAAGRLSMGHARALITAADPAALAETVIARGLSVRQTEALARAARKSASARAAGVRPPIDADLAALERQLSDSLGLKVAIRHAGGGGSVTVAYSSLDQLDMLCQRLSGEAF